MKSIIEADGYQFIDLNGNGSLDVYEDWRNPIEWRVADLVERMTLEEKAGLMLIDTFNALDGGAVDGGLIRTLRDSNKTVIVLAQERFTLPGQGLGEDGKQEWTPEDEDEEHHLDEPGRAQGAERERPGEQEDRLDVEHEEEEGEDVVAHVRLTPVAARCIHT